MYDSRCAGHSPGSEVNGEDEDDDDETFDQIPVRDLDPLCGTDAEHDRNSEEDRKKKKREKIMVHYGQRHFRYSSVVVFSLPLNICLSLRAHACARACVSIVVKFSLVVLNCACVHACVFQIVIHV